MLARLAAIAALLTFASTAHAQTETPARFETGLEERTVRRARRGERVDFNLEDGDLMDLVRMMTTITGRRFLVTGAARELRATVASTEPVTRAEAYQAFLAILNANGLTLVRRGRYHVITDSQNVPRQPTEVTDDDSPPPALDQFVTWIHRVRHMPVPEASQLLEGLRSAEGALIPYEPTGTLIVIDTGSNIRRMRRILREVDVAQSTAHTWVEPVHHANAAQLVTTLSAIFESPGASATPAARTRPGQSAAAAPTPAPSAEHAPMRIIAEERTNSLILIGTEPEYRRVIALLRELDRRDANATAAVRVVRLQHADSESVTTTLQSLLGGASTPAAAASAPPTVEGLNGRVRVEAHSDLNALVITATPADFRVVHELIEQLDVAPRQVFLEMVLMELTVDDEDQLGMDVLGGLANMFGEGLLGVLSSASGSALTQGLTMGILGPNLPGTSQPSFGIQMQALAANTQANIIATPYVLALDNRQALINVGQNVPLQGSSVPSIPSLLSPSIPEDAADQADFLQSLGGQSGGRRDTGTIVNVTPHINDDGEVRLEIEAEDSRQGPTASGNLSAAVVNQSITETELVARDGQTVVIGGLMRDSVETTQSGLPILSEIPILGALFGRQTQHTVKRNLLFFITPHIIRGPSDLRAIFERRMRERREFLERHMVFEGRDWEPPIDYARTRGLVGEMLDTLGDVEAEAEALTVQPDPEPEHRERAPLDVEGSDSES